VGIARRILEYQFAHRRDDDTTPGIRDKPVFQILGKIQDGHGFIDLVETEYFRHSV